MEVFGKGVLVALVYPKLVYVILEAIFLVFLSAYVLHPCVSLLRPR